MMFDEEGRDTRNNDALHAEHARPENRTPLAGDGKQRPTLASELADILDSDEDTKPVSFSDRVQFCEPSVTVGSRLLESEKDARIAELEAAIRLMVQAAYEADERERNHWCAVIMDIGREALG